MATTIKFSLDTDEIKKAIRGVEDYKKGLVKKCHKFVERLADEGIKVAVRNSGQYGQYITYSKDIKDSNTGAIAVMDGKSGELIRMWIGEDGLVTSAAVMPILMAEFGSGHRASDAAGLPNAQTAKQVGAGQGTFPGQTHAFDPDGWYWMDLQGEWHHSKGEEPTMPMFKAVLGMKVQIKRIAKEVFK